MRRLLLLILLFLNIVVNAQNKYALVIGIGDYPKESGWGTIHGDNDIPVVVDMLKHNSFAENNIQILRNDKATKQAIYQALDKLTQKANKGDVIYIHFSGHGQPFEDTEPLDEDDGWDEAIIPYDAEIAFVDGGYDGSNHIIDDDLHSYFQELQGAVGKTGFVMVVIDACHAGGASRSEEDDDYAIYCRGKNEGFSPSGKNYHPRINAKSNYTIQKDENASHIVVMEACRSYQSNYEIKQDNNYYGPLSYYVSKYFRTYKIEPNIQCVLGIKAMMDSDKRLIRQNMVYETSLN